MRRKAEGSKINSTNSRAPTKADPAATRKVKVRIRPLEKLQKLADPLFFQAVQDFETRGKQR